MAAPAGGSRKSNYALLVIDMQERFRPCVSQHMMTELNGTIDLCRQLKVPVVYTMHGHKYPEIDGGELYRFWTGDLSTVGAADWQFMPELRVDKAADLIVDEKRRYDAFYGTPLDGMLRQMGVNTVIITGVVTNLCCETTARSAFVRDYTVLFPSDGNGAHSDETHRATLLNIAHGFGTVAPLADVRKRLQERYA